MAVISFTRLRSVLLAAVAGCTVANFYYGQPILGSLALSLGTTPTMATAVVVATLLGNAVAQLFVVPLADRVERRRLIQVLLVVQAAAMLVMASAHGLPTAIMASVGIGLGGGAAMVVLPYAAALTPAHERGRATGTVMSGVLLGILFSRGISGIISTALTWRATYLAGAVVALSAAVLLVTFPSSRVNEPVSSYPGLLGSVALIVVRDRFVQRRMLIGALGFVSFNLLWTGLTLLLSGHPYGYSDLVIGLFGVLGLAGALVAKNAGIWFDRGHGVWVSRLGWVATALAWVGSLATGVGGATGVTSVIVTVLLLDAGMQAQHITNQSTLLSARPTHTARVTTGYMSANVLAGAAGSGIAATLYPRYGWTALAVVGLVCSGLALIALSGNRARTQA